ncbi:MBL fold metallo-hydrolase [Pseudonocardia hydrocarbonoxydans]|uniref:MBL fold metallo-hydrolase n=1 Tax=Pseudonocardia hydrocarbonoxydans TaxID=76726 RepID=A0A4Y3WG68_9PSEU|nr:MBL fold metallo-hydrolase [Pseudonocardia hydrocarbonoxydans]GEC17863.1 MBL fold metallo-hydrolase [Pseudonocardia hydrocarbonoxydans]
MRLALLGVRGSTPAPGAAFVRYGGHTSCVAVLPDGPGPPALLLDAGTGLRDLGTLLPGGCPFDGALVLTHLHWDHVQGLPFCPPLDHPGARVAVHLPAPQGADAAALLARGMSPPHFPIGPDGLRGRWSFAATPDGFDHAGLTVTVARIAHRGRTHGVRVESGGRAVAYLPDHSPATASPPLAAAARRLAAGVDVLLHDAQFTAAERATADAYGHATVDDAVAFSEQCGARALVLTHHAPSRTDDELDALARCVAGRAPRVTVAIQGTVLDVR